MDDFFPQYEKGSHFLNPLLIRFSGGSRSSSKNQSPAAKRLQELSSEISLINQSFEPFLNRFWKDIPIYKSETNIPINYYTDFHIIYGEAEAGMKTLVGIEDNIKEIDKCVRRLNRRLAKLENAFTPRHGDGIPSSYEIEDFKSQIAIAGQLKIYLYALQYICSQITSLKDKR